MTKFLTLFFAYFIFLSSALAGLPPTTIKGQADSAKSTTFNFEVPNKQATKINGGSLVETGNSNILSNPSMEGSVHTMWTRSPLPLAEVSDVVHGKVAFDFQPTAVTFEFAQDSTINATAFADGSVQGLAYCRIKIPTTVTADIKFAPRRAGAIVSGLEVSVPKTGKWELVKVPFVLGATSNGVSVHSAGYAAITASSIKVDDCFVGAVDLKQDINVVGPWTTGTCTSTWTANTTTTCKYRQVGDSAEIKYQLAVTGAPTATTLSLNMPTGITIDTNKTVTVDELEISGNVLDASASAYYAITGVIVSSTSVALQNTASPKAQISNASPVTFASGDFISATVKVPVTQFSGASSVYTAQNADTDWKACGVTTSDFTGFGTVSGIDMECKRHGSDLLVRGRWTVGTATATEARLALKFNGVALTVKSTPAATLAGTMIISGNSSTYYGAYVLAEPSVSYMVFTHQTSTGNAYTKVNGTSFSSGQIVSINARIPIEGWTNSNVIIGTFKDSVTSQGSNSADIQSVYFGSSADCSTACTTGNCTICNQVGTKITSVSFSSTGIYNLNGIDGTKYNCSGSGYGSAIRIGLHNRSLSSSSLANLRFFDPVSPTTTGNVGLASVTCIGIP